ncbi:MAG: hypothetical protein IV090_18705 [Candidatus Sericytochromatia bacterium]|nr:hypothetical protein [Candidatus Sericytochromatia bacterium]
MIRSQRTGLFALTLLLSLSGCPAEPDPCGTPGTAVCPGPTATPTPAVTGTVIPAPTTNVQLLITDSNVKNVSGAEVEISAAAIATKTAITDGNGLVNFQQLRLDADYTIRVKAAGYVETVRNVNFSALPPVGTDQAHFVAIKLDPKTATLTGNVTDSSGKPVSAAVIFDSKQSTLSDANGNFSLSYSESVQLRLSISKQGFNNQIKTQAVLPNQNIQLGAIALAPKNRQVQVSFDTSKSPFGLSGETALARLKAFQDEVVKAGFGLKPLGENMDNLSDTDILVLTSPNKAFSAEEIGAIQAFVLNGGKVVVLGEWAGFGGFNASATNLMLKPFGIAFGEDTLRENNSGMLTFNSFSSHPITDSLKQVTLYQSGSVQIQGSANAKVVIRTGASSFRIASNDGSFGTVLASTYGSGKLVLVGDSSCFSSDDANGNGVPDLREGDNLRLGLQILNW